MGAGLGAVRAGAMENDVAAEVMHAAIEAGSERAGMEPFVVSGPRIPGRLGQEPVEARLEVRRVRSGGHPPSGDGIIRHWNVERRNHARPPGRRRILE